MSTLTLSTCMASNMDFFCRELAGYLSRRLAHPVTFLDGIPWQQREQLLDAGQVDICWICGLPYVWKADLTPGLISLLAAPVMADARYRNQPVYFSDVVVHRDSPYHNLIDLRGAVWAYNEPASHSGYNVVRYALARRGTSLAFFGQVVASGSHQNSLKMILAKEIDASAIDSTVLETELQQDPSIRSQIRIIDSFGPSPMPPWVVSQQLSLAARQSLQEIFIGMGQDLEGKALLKQARMARFANVEDRDYDPIREMARIAAAGDRS